MAKLVCHLQKYNRLMIKSIQQHNNSSNLDGDSNIIFADKAILNYFLISSPDNNLTKDIFSRISKREDSYKTIRKDAVLICDILVSASADFFIDLSLKEINKFFSVSCEFLKTKYSTENCVYAVVHMHEAVPHMHFGIIPMTSDNFLCAKKLFERNELQRLHSALPAHLSKFSFKFENTKSNNISYISPPSIIISNEVVESYANQLKMLEKENNRLKLEKIYIERKLRSIIDIIKDNPSLEEIFFSNSDKNSFENNMLINS